MQILNHFVVHLPLIIMFCQLYLNIFKRLKIIYIYGAKSLQSCLTLCNPMDYSLPGSPVHGILQARILEWVTVSSARGSSQPREWTWVSCIEGRFFIDWAMEFLGGSRWWRICLQCRKPMFNPWVRKIPGGGNGYLYSSILAWKIPWTEEPGGLQSMES